MAEKSMLYVCEGSHLYLFYLNRAGKKLTNVLPLGETIVPPNLVLFGHGHM